MHILAKNPEWVASLDALDTLLREQNASTSARMEALLEDLYTRAGAHGATGLRDLEHVLAEAPPVPAIAAWHALVRLAVAYDERALDALDHALGQAPPRTAWLVASESARLTYQHAGPRAAWLRIEAIEPVPVSESDSWLDDGPLVIHALLLKLRLSAASGSWASHDALIEPFCARFAEPDDPRVLRIRLASADHDLMRGRYQRAARTLDRIASYCQGDLRRELLAIRLHALVACAGPERETLLREEIERTLSELDDTRESTTDDAFRLPPDACTELEQRIAHLRVQARADGKKPDPGQVRSLSEALAVEHWARSGESHVPPRETLSALLPHVEALLLRDESAEHHEAWIRLRLLWCRLIIDLGVAERYDLCEATLTDIIDEATLTGLVPLVMSAYDQRAILHASGPDADLELALADAGQAGDMSVSLLAENAVNDVHDNQRVMERALLGTLLPALDRVVDLLLRKALDWESDGGRQRAGWDRTRRERWLRFGRAIHDYVEQSQALALKEARHAYGAGGAPVPHRFALIAPGEEPVSPLPRLRRALRRQDTVLQYFVTGRFLVIFFFGRARFDWLTLDVVTEVKDAGVHLDAPTAHAALLHLLSGCDAWLKGESTPAHRSSATPLCRVLLPDVVIEHLEEIHARHIRIIPHDVLYRVPFSRLHSGNVLPLQRASLSLHPTAGLAADSASPVTHSRRRKTLGYLLGPGLRYAARERAIIRNSLGHHWVQLARMTSIDTTDDSSGFNDRDAIMQAMEEVDILHIACHGGRPFQRREAFMKLGTGPWKLSEVASLRLRSCAVAILQSCWTGWMEHERTNPVQGFPQALCDAGSAAVIAPLVKVPDTLTPIFADVLYRTLRFLPAERALHYTLQLLREHGADLVVGDEAASRDLREFGPFDTLEYRYMGQTSLNLAGGAARRFIGRLSLWWWRRKLKRQTASRAPNATSANEHANSSSEP